jgi:hypothetical protein
MLILIVVTKVRLMARAILVKSCDLAAFIKKCLIMPIKQKKKRTKTNKKKTNDILNALLTSNDLIKI